MKREPRVDPTATGLFLLAFAVAGLTFLLKPSSSSGDRMFGALEIGLVIIALLGIAIRRRRRSRRTPPAS